MRKNTFSPVYPYLLRFWGLGYFRHVLEIIFAKRKLFPKRLRFFTSFFPKKIFCFAKIFFWKNTAENSENRIFAKMRFFLRRKRNFLRKFNFSQFFLRKNAKCSFHDFPRNYLRWKKTGFLQFFLRKNWKKNPFFPFKIFLQKFCPYHALVPPRFTCERRQPSVTPAAARPPQRVLMRPQSSLPEGISGAGRRRARRRRTQDAGDARVASAFGYGDARASPASGPKARPQ